MALRGSGTSATASFSSHLQTLPSSKSSRQWRNNSVLPIRYESSRNAGMLVVRAADGVDVDIKEGLVKGDILPSGEGTANFSLLNSEDLTKHCEPELFKPGAQPTTQLADVMSRTIHTASPDQALEEVDRYFSDISGLPVVDRDHKCFGVLSEKDLAKASILKTKVKEVVTTPAITLSADRVVSDLFWDPYLGEVTVSEKVEEPPQYLPPPPIPAEDICIRDQVETLMYTLERTLPGQLDNDKIDVLCSMLSATVEVQNPVVCFRGSNKCSEWLRALMQVKASINLHELYYENDMEDPDKRWVHAVWTVRFLENVHTSSGDLIENLRESELSLLSGETVFEMEKSGLVSRISSTWYVLQEDGGLSFTKAKDSLWRLLGRAF